MKTKLWAGLIVGVLFFMSAFQVNAQDKIDVTLILDSRITDSERVRIQDLEISSTGQGANVMTLVMQNTTSEVQEDLYLYISVESSSRGILAEFDQKSGRPFSMRPNQRTQGNNNQFESGFPGISESISLDGDLTSDGESLLSRGVLPPAIYTFNISVYQGANRSDGGQLVGQSAGQFEVGASGDEQDIILLAPGANLDEGVTIPVRRPFFTWSGGGANSYRLIVVHAIEGESAESLLSQAYQSSQNTQLDFKMFDQTFRNRTETTYPASGAQPLIRGEKYFWQIFGEIATPSGTETRSSEIWEFTVERTDGSETTNDEMDDSMQQILSALQEMVSQEDIDELISGGYNLSSIILDGRTYRGQDALVQIFQLMNAFEAGELEIVD